VISLQQNKMKRAKWHRFPKLPLFCFFFSLSPAASELSLPLMQVCVA